MTSLGVVTIGQSPRHELADEVAAWLPSQVELKQFGALDELTDRELDEVRADRHDTDTMVSLLRSGESITMARSRILPRVQDAVNRAAAACDVVLLACTGEFPELSCDVALVHPDEVVSRMLPALVTAGNRVGVVYPLPVQEALVRAKYADSTLDVIMTDASPYVPDAMHLVAEAAARLAASGASILVLDCIGYTADMARAAASTGLPVVLSRRLATRVASELL